MAHVPRRQPPYLSTELRLDQLFFDPQNPRFPPGLDGTDLQAVLAYMLSDASLLDLTASIAEQGFFPGEPLLVAPTVDLPNNGGPPAPSDNDRFYVIEGNRRLASIWLLAHPD